MLRYDTEKTNKFEFRARRAYPMPRSDFAQTAYVVLTRVTGIETEKCRG